MKKRVAMKILFDYIIPVAFISLTVSSSLFSAPKKVLVYYNKSGGGHLSAAKVIEDSLPEDDYELNLINFSESYLDPRNPLCILTNGAVTTDGSYCDSLKRGEIDFANFASMTFAPLFVFANHKSITEELTEELTEEYILDRPGLVISTIPFVNGYLAEVTQKLDIPLIVTSQDGDVRHFLGTLKGRDHENLRVTVGINGEEAKMQFVEEAGIDESRVFHLPHPVRAIFFNEEPNAREEKREELDIPEEAFTIMILLGGAGGEKIFDYAKTILEEVDDAYVIAFIGKSEDLRSKLDSILNSEKLRIIGFTKEIPQLLKASDLFLTKPGPNSIVEALYMGTPMLLDYTTQKLTHEVANERFAISHNYAEGFRTLEEMKRMIHSLKENEEGSYSHLKRNVDSYEKGDYRIEFRDLVEELLQSSGGYDLEEGGDGVTGRGGKPTEERGSKTANSRL